MSSHNVAPRDLEAAHNAFQHAYAWRDATGTQCMKAALDELVERGYQIIPPENAA